MKTILRTTILSIPILVGMSSCSTTKVEHPKGISKGYSSARLARTVAATSTSGEFEDSPLVNAQIQSAIGSNFRQHDMAFSGDAADLIVAYLIIRQNPASTAMDSDHFGYGRDAWKIIDEALKRGVIENKSPDSFEAGAIVIDILDSKKNELIYRNSSKRDIIAIVSADERQRRISDAVTEALKPFFK